jgi:hypothetical protein
MAPGCPAVRGVQGLGGDPLPGIVTSVVLMAEAVRSQASQDDERAGEPELTCGFTVDGWFGGE